MNKPSLKNIKRAEPVSIDESQMVSMAPLAPDNKLPLLIRPLVEGMDLTAWAGKNRDLLEEKLLDHGGILFRGFGQRSSDELEAFIRDVSGEPLEYKERSSPRTQVSGKVYTSTEHPPNQHIFLHNENSYQSTWPMKIFFMCEIAPPEGGETPIADCRRIVERIDPEIRAKFDEKGFRIIRNFNQGMGLPWETVFGTNDRAVVDAYCAKNGIQPEWKADGGLRTITQRPFPTATHPITGVKTWFNHGAFFHVTTLDPAISQVLLACMAEEDLPTNTFYGDGAPIEPEVLDHLRDAYHQETVLFPWQVGDILMLDNMLTAHGRSPFKGPRKIVVGMSQPMTRQKMLENLGQA